MAKRKTPKQNDEQPELPLDPIPEVRGQESEAGGVKAESSKPKPEDGGQMPEASEQRSEVGGRKSELETKPGEAAASTVASNGDVKIGNGAPAPLRESYKNWFLDYASYVILDRAVPHLDDGLKPVQRRVLHTLWDMDDGRFHKVANVVGATMKLHPHGDASIGAALVAIAQRGWLIEPQGNFGNMFTGDEAAAPRYIEARLTPFAREVLFNPKTTRWQLSYDGRNREPITLPAKFPITLREGAEGIAVGLSTKILPHNFNDLCRASINHLQGKRFASYPIFRRAASPTSRSTTTASAAAKLRSARKSRRAANTCSRSPSCRTD